MHYSKLLPFFRFHCKSCSLPCHKTHKQHQCDPPPLKTLPPYQPKSFSQDENGNDDSQVLSEDQVSSLMNHPEVQRKFRDGRVKEVLRRIDSAKDRANTLEKEMEDPAFLEFCDDILEAIGFKHTDEKPVTLHDIFLQQCKDL